MIEATTRLFTGGEINLDACRDARAYEALQLATDLTGRDISCAALLIGALKNAEGGIDDFTRPAFPQGVSREVICQTLEHLISGASGGAFDGRRERFSAAALAALDRFEADAQRYGRYGLELLVTCAFENLNDTERQLLWEMRPDRVASALRTQLDSLVSELPPLFDDSERLVSEEFSGEAIHVLERAATCAAEAGFDSILPPHILLALLEESEGVAEQVVRLQTPPGLGFVRVGEILGKSFTRGPSREEPIGIERGGFAPATTPLLIAAQRRAKVDGRAIDSWHLFGAILDAPEPRVRSALTTSPLSFDLDKMKRQLDDLALKNKSRSTRDVEFRLPRSVLAAEDLTHAARSGKIEAAVGLDSIFDPILRALYRKNNGNVLLCGERGVGKTTVLRELARRAAAGKIQFLERKRLVRVDCAHVDPRESANKLAALVAHVSGRSDIVLCVDGLGALLRSEGGGDNKLALRSALSEDRIRLVGIMSEAEYEDLVATDQELLELFTHVPVVEPSVELAEPIVEKAALALQREFRVDIEPQAVQRALRLSDEYILSQRLPLKATQVLRRVCEDVDYDRSEGGVGSSVVTADRVIRVVSNMTGVPESTLAGVIGNADFEEQLSRAVIGQPEAVGAMAQDLRSIKGGRTGKGRPASVVLFAGLTGVGKTELAKAVARLYSASKRLRTYTMGNFLEAHSVSGIIGVPAGYHGHDLGGPLINDLNADPHCVFLLDEAEKAHPDVWKPFLNLFDEGWITDRRGVKAFADRAIFILTSNAGADVISRMSLAGASLDEISDAVKRSLSEVVHKASGQPSFSPEFLARIGRIVIFEPLNLDAMRGITQLAVAREARESMRRSDKKLIVDSQLVDRIAELGNNSNIAAGGKEGGRIVSKLVAQLIRTPVENAERERPDDFSRCSRIEVDLAPRADVNGDGKPGVDVRFTELSDFTRREIIEMALAEADALSSKPVHLDVASRLRALRDELGTFSRESVLLEAQRELQEVAELCARRATEVVNQLRIGLEGEG